MRTRLTKNKRCQKKVERETVLAFSSSYIRHIEASNLDILKHGEKKIQACAKVVRSAKHAGDVHGQCALKASLGEPCMSFAKCPVAADSSKF
jgi:hypothetical protein